MRRKWLSTVLVVALAASFINAPCGGKDDQDNNFLLSLLITQNVLASASAFHSSCDRRASNKTCTNNFGASTASASNCSGTFSTTSRCPATDSIGLCKYAQSEDVFYTGNANCSNDTNCQTLCTGTLLGTYNVDYTGQ